MSEVDEGYLVRLQRLLRRWNPRGMLISDARAQAAIALLKNPERSCASAAELERAHLTCEAAVHPVLQQTIPSAFRVSSFMPTTAVRLPPAS